MIGTPPKSTQYSIAFERCWSVHRVGNKKAAWKAGNNSNFTDSTWLWLEEYLTHRWKNDERWLEGKYVPHLSSIINQERWDDPYKKVQVHRDRYDKANEQAFIPMTDEQRESSRLAYQKAMAELRH
jgi:hypothetical protein